MLAARMINGAWNLLKTGQGLLKDCLCCTEWFCVYNSYDPWYGVSCRKKKDIWDDSLIIGGPYKTEVECESSPCELPPPVYKYYCNYQTGLCETCCESGACWPGDTQCWEVNGDLYDDPVLCEERCEKRGSCCTWDPCVRGPCVPVDSAWDNSSGTCKEVFRDPYGNQWYSDGCEVREEFYSGGPCTGTFVGYPSDTCDNKVPGKCLEITKDACLYFGGKWFGGKTCAQTNCPGDCPGTGEPSPCGGEAGPPDDYCINNPYCHPAIKEWRITVQGAKLFLNPDGTPLAPEYQALVDAINDRPFIFRPSVDSNGEINCVGGGIVVPVDIRFPGQPDPLRHFVSAVYSHAYAEPPDIGSAICRNVTVSAYRIFGGFPCQGTNSAGNVIFCEPTRVTYSIACSCEKYYECTGTFYKDLTQQTGQCEGSYVDFSDATVTIRIS